MKSKIIISKRDFWNHPLVKLKMYEVLGALPTSETEIKDEIVVRNILEFDKKYEEVTLVYPEKYMPNNFAHLFWERINVMLEEGSTIKIKTSDVRGLTYISPTLCKQKIEYFNQETQQWTTYHAQAKYGTEIGRAIVETSF